MEMSTRRRSVLTPKSVVVGLASHAGMGIALGLVLAGALIWMPAFQVASLIDHSMEPWSIKSIIVGTLVATFGIDAALTGFLLTLSEGRAR
jgi:hypothetical protein